MEAASNELQEIQNEIAQVISAIGPPPSSSAGGRGIVICAGGTRYFTNAWVLIKLLRLHDCALPIEIWALDERELDDSMRQLAESLGVSVRYAGRTFSKQAAKTVRGRWQWALKPYAILHSSYDEVLYLDADSFPVRDPAELFECAAYRAEGSVFWPDRGMMDKEHPIWEVMEVPHRPEPEFETGQMVINKRRCWEPLQLTLWMNLRSDFFYHFIWGDKDTFRFAWHRFGRSFAMVPYPLQTLFLPGEAEIVGTFCQHDFSGNWLFQHRNTVKWSLLEENPRIPGFLFEAECRAFLVELRALWNGRVGQVSAMRTAGDQAECPIMADLLEGVWLLEDRRPKDLGCCLPPEAWTDKRHPLPWPNLADSTVAFPDGLAIGEQGNGLNEEPDGEVETRSTGSLRCKELSLLPDSIGRGADKELSWWQINSNNGSARALLELVGEDGVSVKLKPDGKGGWQGYWWQKDFSGKRHSCRLLRPNQVYPETRYAKPLNGNRPARPIHVANHALGIGDAIAGLYAAAGMAQAGVSVVYHTRRPEWLSRASCPGLTITDSAPPVGTVDLNADYKEQLRYAEQKTRWYGMLASPAVQKGKLRDFAALPFPPARPMVNVALSEPVLDFSNYVLLAPFASRPARDWPAPNWRRLAFLLNEAGYEVVAIGVKRDEERLRETFERSYAYWVLDQSPQWVASAMLDAQCVIGPDSGMIHLAGLLGVPAVCLHSHLPAAFLFSHAPTVVSLAPDSQCVFCRWQRDKGYNDSCAGACSALATISPERVMAMVSSKKIARVRFRLQREVDRQTKRARSSDGSKLGRSISVKENRPDVIAYTYEPNCGLGEAAEANIKAMRALGFTVEQRLWEHDLAIEPALRDPNQIYYHHWHPQMKDPLDKWRHYLPETGTGARHIAFWAYEVEGELPESFQIASRLMSEIWTPSTFCQRLFSATGLPVHVVPHTVPALDLLDDLPSSGGRAPFTVLTLFDAWSRFERKNPEAVIRVFQKAFANRMDVRLILKGRHMTGDQVKRLEADCGWDSRITVMNQFLSERERDKLFASADVYLGLQRSEGFGLNLARSLGMGLPVITTGWSGLTEFCRENNSYLVPYSLQSVSELANEFTADGTWAEPNEAVASTLLARVATLAATDDHTLKKKRENGRELIENQFSETALKRTLERRLAGLGQIAAHLKHTV
jgi:glycosyltransferase involved in cell wall biosynthesis